MDHFGSNIKEVKSEDRRPYVPSDMMNLQTYTEFKVQFNARLDKEKAKVIALNIERAKYQQHEEPVPEAYPMETVTMLSPKSFVITLHDYKRIHIPIGILQVPIELSDHWYMEANGVKKYNPSVPEIPKELAPANPSEVQKNPFKKGK